LLLVSATGLTLDAVYSLELLPALSPQTVFVGDTISLTCRATTLDLDTSHVTLSWVRLNTLVTNRTDITVTTRRQTNVLDTSLRFTNLTKQHFGRWLCLADTSGSSLNKSITLEVVPSDAIHCSPTVTVTNKGTYVWNKTLSGRVADLPCDYVTSAAVMTSQARAFHRCNSRGLWTELNVAGCEYTSYVTRVLTTMTKVRHK